MQRMKIENQKYFETRLNLYLWVQFYQYNYKFLQKLQIDQFSLIVAMLL